MADAMQISLEQLHYVFGRGDVWGWLWHASRMSCLKDALSEEEPRPAAGGHRVDVQLRRLDRDTCGAGNAHASGTRRFSERGCRELDSGGHLA